MRWIALLFFLAFGGAYLLNRRRGKKRREQSLEYRFAFSTDEVFHGEYLYLDQVVVNTSEHTVPFLKLETLMPEGLKIVLNPSTEAGKKTGAVHSAESVWMLPPHSQVSRRWRILAEKRGIYPAERVEMHAVANDALGSGEFSLRLQPQADGCGILAVLPRAAEWVTQIALSSAFSGERTEPRGLIRDPMMICGIREYEGSDPLNTVDWKQSAKLGRMVVRKTEAIQNDRYNIVLNMQSTLIEPDPQTLSSPHYIEECITICASLLDSAVRRNIPVRLIANTEPEGLPGGALHESGSGPHIFCSEEYRSGDSVIEAYRLLSRLPLRMSIPVEALEDDISAYPEQYARDGNLVFVTTFLDERMLLFYRRMRERGIRVIFFVVTAYQNAVGLPSDMDVHFRMSRWIGGVGYGW